MDLPTNVTVRGQTYWFIKSWPSRVMNLAPTAKFRVSLGIKVGVSRTKITKAAIEAQELFERQVSRLDSSDVNVTRALLADKEARSLLSLLGLDERMLDPARISITFDDEGIPGSKPTRVGVNVPSGENLTDEDKRFFIEEWARALAKSYEEQIDRVESVEPEVKRRALQMLGKPKRKGPRFISELWGPHCKRQGWDMTSKKGREKQANWDRAIAVIGDHPLVNAADEEINRGFREMLDDAEERGLKPNTAIRYLSDVRACLIDAAGRYGLNWNIRSNSVGKRKQPVVVTETADEKTMIKVARGCIKRADPTGVIGLMWLHGVSPEEIASIEATSGLKRKIPHLIIPDGKTKDRPRVVVPAFGLETLLLQMDATIQYCRDKVDPGANFNKWLKTHLGAEPKITGRSLRHGCRNAYVMSGANNGIMKAALGWSGGDQTLAMHYGASGVVQSKFIKALQRASYEAHAPIVKALK